MVAGCAPGAARGVRTADRLAGRWSPRRGDPLATLVEYELRVVGMRPDDMRLRRAQWRQWGPWAF